MRSSISFGDGDEKADLAKQHVTKSSDCRADAEFAIRYLGLECIKSFIAQLCLLNSAPRKQLQVREKLQCRSARAASFFFNLYLH